MIVRVQVDHKEYQVKIIDLNACPVVAVIDGEKFEIWPEKAAAQPLPDKQSECSITYHGDENGYAKLTQISSPSPTVAQPSPQVQRTAGQPSTGGSQPGTFNGLVRSPLPGIIISVSVEPGNQVHAGQQLCVLEAMKMNNSILASQKGTVTSVNIHPGQPVRAREILIEVSDS